jgi:hypothetical protein
MGFVIDARETYHSDQGFVKFERLYCNSLIESEVLESALENVLPA